MAGMTRRILVVDDSDDDTELLRRAVEQTKVPWTITAVLRDGEQAIRHLEKFANAESASLLPEMLLLDVKMPRMGGFAVLDWIGRNMPEQIQTIMFSSSPQPDDIQRARELGAKRYIMKPGTFHELLVIVRRLDALMLEYYSGNEVRVSPSLALILRKIAKILPDGQKVPPDEVFPDGRKAQPQKR